MVTTVTDACVMLMATGALTATGAITIVIRRGSVFFVAAGAIVHFWVVKPRGVVYLIKMCYLGGSLIEDLSL